MFSCEIPCCQTKRKKKICGRKKSKNEMACGPCRPAYRSAIKCNEKFSFRIRKHHPARIVRCEDLMGTCGKISTKHSKLGSLSKREKKKILKAIYKAVVELTSGDVISSKEVCDIMCEEIKQIMRLTLLKFPDSEVK